MKNSTMKPSNSTPIGNHLRVALKHSAFALAVALIASASSIGCAGDDTTEQNGMLSAGFGASPNEIRTEFTFALYIEKLGEPILIIKTSWGGKDLHTAFRSPGAGPYVWSDFESARRKERGDNMEKERADTIQATGVYYRLMLGHVKKVLGDLKRVVPDYDPKLGYEVAGFVWFQGFNDLVSDWNPKMTGPEFEAFKMKAQAEHFTPEEWKRLQAGTSNGGYHDPEAAKIMAPIGKAFATAMANLRQTQQKQS